MPTKIYHKDHGFVITSDVAEINRILAKGGEIIVKNKEIDAEPKPEVHHTKPETLKLKQNDWKK